MLNHDYESFWAKFYGEYYGKKPTVIREFRKKPVLSDNDIFNALMSISEFVKRDEGVGSTSFFVDTQILMSHKALRVTEASDRSLAGYCDRMSKMHDGKKFYMSQFQMQPHLEWQAWRELCGFLEPLYRRHGVPASGIDCALYMGTDPVSTAGVHKDGADVLCLVVSGVKRMRVWPYERLKHLPEKIGLLKYDEYLEGSEVLEGRAGDILYWPASHWHVGEIAEGMAASVSLPLYYQDNQGVLGSVTSAMSKSIMENLAQAGMRSHPALGFDVTKQDPYFSALETSVKKSIAGFDFDRAIATDWLQRVSSYGFPKARVRKQTRELSMDDTVSADPIFPVLHRKTDSEWVIASGGVVTTIPYIDWLGPVLDEINKGEKFRVGEFADKKAAAIGGAVKSETIFKILKLLWKLGAVTI